MILPNPDYPLPAESLVVGPCPRPRLGAVVALHEAARLLERSRRSCAEDERLLRAARLAAEGLGLVFAADEAPRLAADLVLVRALVATGHAGEAEALGRRLWMRAARHPDLRRGLARTMADFARGAGNQQAADHWTGLAVTEPVPVPVRS